MGRALISKQYSHQKSGTGPARAAVEAPKPSAGERTIYVDICTELGLIVAALYPDRAPLTVANFLSYVDNGWYDDTSFYRVVTPTNEREARTKISVVQGGLKEDLVSAIPPISHEPTSVTDLRHSNGTLSAARRQEGAAGAFFICLGDHPQLDYGGSRAPDGLGFAAFGQVVEGFDIVEQIWRGASPQPFLVREIGIVSVHRSVHWQSPDNFT